MRIGISGASGFVGKNLTDYLAKCKHQIIPLGRGPLREDSFQELVEIIEDCGIVINLSDASINPGCFAPIGIENALDAVAVGI